MINIRRAVISDAAELNEIGNHYILHSPVNFKTAELSLEEREDWISSFGSSGRYQLFVAEENTKIIGFSGSTQFHEKYAYGTSVQTTIYLHPEYRSKGVGTLLYTELLGKLANEDLHRAYAGITLPNEASVAIHKKFGFKKAGVFTEAGRKFGKFWDVLWLERNVKLANRKSKAVQGYKVS